MTAPVRIRRTSREDIAALPAVERSAAELFLSIPALAWIVDDPLTTEVEHAELAAAGTSWVALQGVRPVGFLLAEVIADELHVWEVAVSRDHQGQGIGRRLMAAAVDAARSRGLAAVTLTTFLNVPWNAPFCQRLGFQPLVPEMTGRLAALLAEEAARDLPDRCAMRLALGAAPARP